MEEEGSRGLGAIPKIYKDPVEGLITSDGIAWIESLPEEVLEYIFKLISPYGDFTACSRVCRRWRMICLQACRSRLLSFHNQLSQGELLWSSFSPDDSPGSISKRYSHSAVYHAASQAMFVFGGCTSTASTFNDLHRFDLTSRSWSRPRAIGTYPSPKALATMAENGSSLILFGGWTHPSSYPLHQTSKLFNELHIFDLHEAKWNQISPSPGEAWPPRSAGHSATIHREKMVVFGGLQKQGGIGFFDNSNNTWVYSINEKTWHLQPVLDDVRPGGRYGQSQIKLDEEHLLVLGGCRGNNNEWTDVWLLQMTGPAWRWVQLTVEEEENRGKDIWRHPACRASSDRVVVLGKSKVLVKKSNQAGKVGSVPAPHHMVRNVIGSVPLSARAALHNNSSSSEENEPYDPRHRGGGGNDAAEAGPSREMNQRLDREMHRGPVKPKQRMMENRQRQLASLNKMEERIRNSRTAAGPAKPASAVSPPALCPNHRMALSVLDTSRAISEHTVTWLPPSPLLPGSDVPQECCLYSLVQGRTELIMFGGLKRDISVRDVRDVDQANAVTNSLHILHPYIQKI